MIQKSRLDALTDGVFAVAMTLLVIDLRLPRGFHSADAQSCYIAWRSLDHVSVSKSAEPTVHASSLRDAEHGPIEVDQLAL
jgi:Endosomal/lysosomal potassium channel TMEM175